MKVANRVAFNTIISYGRMVLTIGISLFSTRIVLNGLGSVDFGIYNLIAGIIVMLSFLNVAMTTSTQRFLSFHHSQNVSSKQSEIFFNSLLIHVVIGFIVSTVLELVGYYIFGNILKIPVDRIDVAKSIYHFMSFTVFFTIVSVPYTALINSYENMVVIAFINIIETLLKFIIAISLLYVKSDKLMFYGLSMATITVVSFMLYLIYCLLNYSESRNIKFNLYNKKMIIELTSFAGWNLFGTLCGLGRTQGIAVLLNSFFGSMINASYGIANQVSSQMNFFSGTMLQAINPQIMKSEGVGDRQRMLKLSMLASKFGFFLFAFLAIPSIFEMESILNFWLKKTPEHAIVFCQLILIATLSNQLTIGVQSALQATGKIKIYQAVVGTLLLLNLPLSYFLLKIGMPAYFTIVGFIAIELFACVLRLFFLKAITGLNIGEYANVVFLHEVIPVIILILVCWLVTQFTYFQYRFILTFVMSTISFGVSFYLYGLNKDEKDKVNSMVLGIYKRYIK